MTAPRALIEAAIHTDWPTRTPRDALAGELGQHGQHAIVVAARALLADRGTEDWEVREAVAWALRLAADPDAVPELATLVGDSDSDVRRAAFDAWLALDPATWGGIDRGARARTELAEALRSRLGSTEADRSALLPGAESWLSAVVLEVAGNLNWTVRRDIAILLGGGRLPISLDALIALADDADDDARDQGLRSLIRRRHPRAPALVLAGLLDGHAKVRGVCQTLCDEAADHPVLAEVTSRFPGFVWSEQPARVEAIVEWTVKASLDLLQAEASVRPYRSGIGRTHYPKGERTVRIDLNLDPLVEAPAIGEEVVRGVVLHELGHHRYDYRQPGFKSANGVARQLGVLPVFDVLLDERLERGLRSEFPALGEYLDRTLSFVFGARPLQVPLDELAHAARLTPAALAQGIALGGLPGTLDPGEDGVPQVSLRTTDLLRFEGLMPPLSAFLLALRGVRDPSRVADAQVRAALDVIPSDLRQLTHGELLRVAVVIASILGVEDDGAGERQRMARLRRGAPRIGEALGDLLERARDVGDEGRWALEGGPGDHWSRGVPERAVPLTSAPRSRPGEPERTRARARAVVNLGRDLGFPRLEGDVEVADKPTELTRIRQQVRPAIRRLRVHLERLATREVDELAVRTGRRLDVACARRLAVAQLPNLMVRTTEEHGADAYLGLIIDRSGSMGGERIERARRFGVMLADAARGVPGLAGHVTAFTDTRFYRLGDFRRHTIGGLETGGGNNDSGALLRAAELALASGKTRRLLVMVSDGNPTACTFESLKGLVQTLERQHGILCAQVAVAKLERQAFPHHFDVSSLSAREAVQRFGRLLERLTGPWR